MDTMGARRSKEQVAPIRRALRCATGPDSAASCRAVVYPAGNSKMLRDTFGHQARQDIDRTVGREGNDELEGISAGCICRRTDGTLPSERIEDIAFQPLLYDWLGLVAAHHHPAVQRATLE